MTWQSRWPLSRILAAAMPDAPFMPVLALENPVGPNNYGSALPTPAKPMLTDAIRVQSEKLPRRYRRAYLERNLAIAMEIRGSCSDE